MWDRLYCIFFYESMGVAWVEVVEEHRRLKELIQILSGSLAR
jgi:hypothetical protein